MKIIFHFIAIPAISLSTLLIQAATSQRQTPAGNGHKKTAAASTPAATGSGPSSSDIHARVAVPSGKHSPSNKTAIVGSAKPAASSTSTPNAAGGTGSNQRATKTVPPPAATGSGPSSSDIHTTTKPTAVPTVKTKPVNKKHKTGNS